MIDEFRNLTDSELLHWLAEDWHDQNEGLKLEDVAVEFDRLQGIEAQRDGSQQALTRVMGELTEARERADQGEKILHAIRRAVGLEFGNGVSLLAFIKREWPKIERLQSVVKMVANQVATGIGFGCRAVRFSPEEWKEITDAAEKTFCSECGGTGSMWSPWDSDVLCKCSECGGNDG